MQTANIITLKYAHIVLAGLVVFCSDSTVGLRIMSTPFAI